MSYREIDPNVSGIYKFTNKINNKSYIGQSVDIRKRLKQHFKNMSKLDLPLYSAINKYGLFNFDFTILEVVDNTKYANNDELVKVLDDLEIKYIEQYEGYTKGYNCTKGGDFGVLGLKMTCAQKKKISENTKRAISEGKIGKKVYMYNLVEKYYITSITIRHASSITGISRSNISKLVNGKYKNNSCSNFIASFSKEDLEIKIKESKLNNNLCFNNGRFTNKIKIRIPNEDRYLTVEEASKQLNISKSYIYSIKNGYKSNKFNFIFYKIS